METGPRPTARGVRTLSLFTGRRVCCHWVPRLLAATVFALVLSLWLGTPVTPSTDAQAAEADPPLSVAAASSLVWVRDATPLVNANNDPTQFSPPEPRYAGSFTKMTPSATRFTTQECYVDNKVPYYNLTVTCTFAAPPAELTPGKSYSLTASFSHSGTNNQGGEGIGEQFWYSSAPKGLVTPATVLKYYPWSPGFSGPVSATWTLTPPTPTAGASFQVYAGLWNRPPCNVTWTYRAKEKTAAAATTTTKPVTTSTTTTTTTPASSGSSTTTKPSTTTTKPSTSTSSTVAVGERDPNMRRWTDEQFEKALADTIAMGGTMADGYVGIVTGCIGDFDIYDYSGLRRKGVRGSKIRVGDTIVTYERAGVRVQMADRDEQRDAGPSIINMASNSVMSFNKLLIRLDEPRGETIVQLIFGSVRIFFGGWGRNSSVSIKTGATICGVRGSDVFVTYDPENESYAPPWYEGPVEYLGAWVLEGHMDVVNETTGEFVTLTDKQTLKAVEGVIGSVGTFTQEKWDEWMKAAGLEDMTPVLGAELEALLAQGTPTTGAPSTTITPPTTTGATTTTVSSTAAPATTTNPTISTSSGPPVANLAPEGPGSTFGSWLSWGLPVLIVVAALVLLAVGSGVYLLRRRRRTGEQSAPPPTTPAASPRFCPDCGSAVTPGSSFCRGCGKRF